MSALHGNGDPSTCWGLSPVNLVMLLKELISRISHNLLLILKFIRVETNLHTRRILLLLTYA
jgi:hypothetical protein